MKTFLDCIPCLVRQSLDSARFATPDETIHAQVLQEVLRAAASMDLHEPPPRMAQQVHRRIRQITGDSDPYREVKETFNRLILKEFAELRERVLESDRPLETAIRLAIAGNVIDFGVRSELTPGHVYEAILHAMSGELEGSVDGFADAVSRADRILYLGDNAGEIVMDRLLIEQISPEKVTFAVRGAPACNDVTMADAQTTGIADMVEVIDNGSDAPGTILDDCSEAFRERFEKADLVIAKGQGNYETLSEATQNIWFLLKAKCPVIARDLGCEVGSLILRRSGSEKNPGQEVFSAAPVDERTSK